MAPGGFLEVVIIHIPYAVAVKPVDRFLCFQCVSPRLWWKCAVWKMTEN